MRFEDRPRYVARAGFVTTPQYFDDSPQQFLELAPKGTGVIQRVLHIPGYEYGLDERARNFGLLDEAAECLARSHCQVIGQVGSNWVHCQGTTGPDVIRRYCQGVREATGVPFLMAGLCLVDALHALGARRISVANAYYRPDWSAGINRFLEQAGFEIVWAGNMVDQGLFPSMDAVLENERQTFWDFPAHYVVEACRMAHEAAPDADAVVQTGAGFRTRPVIETIEGLLGKPLVASDMALYWAMLRELGLQAAPGHGRLAALLGDRD